MAYSQDLLERLYRIMVRIRLCEESLVEPILAGEIRCPCHLYSGEEAIAAGICASLNEDDYVFGNHRSHGHYLAKGGDMFEMVAEIYGRDAGCSRGRGGSMHLIWFSYAKTIFMPPICQSVIAGWNTIFLKSVNLSAFPALKRTATMYCRFMRSVKQP